MADVIFLIRALINGQAVGIRVIGEIRQLLATRRSCAVRVKGREVKIDVEIEKGCKVVFSHGGHGIEMFRLLPFRACCEIHGTKLCEYYTQAEGRKSDFGEASEGRVADGRGKAVKCYLNNESISVRNRSCWTRRQERPRR